MSENIYVGNGTEKFDGDLIEFSLNLSKLKAAAEHIFEFNGEKYIKLKVCKNRDGANQYGKTHYVQVNTFKPEPKQEPVSAPTTQPQGFENDVPF